MMSALIFSGCSNTSEDTSDANNSISVATTLFPLYTIAKQITGDKINVELMILPGESPHSFTPTPRTKEAVDSAQRIFAIGHNLDDWLLDLVDDPSLIVRTDKGITLRKYRHDDGDEHDEHEHGEYDPHYWLDPRNAKIIADTITSELVAIDPANQSYYTEQLKSFKEEMDTLYTEQLNLMKPVKEIPFLTMHDAWGYYAAAFELTLVGSFNPTGAEDPTPKYLKYLQDLIDTTGSKAIFNEPQLPVSGLLPFLADNNLSLGILDPLAGMHGIEVYSHIIENNSKELIATLKSTHLD